MKKLLRPFSFLAFFLSLIAMTTTASAQWTPVTQQFYGQIHIVKFLDAFNLPLVGFVGDDTGIWVTGNGGTSWTRATITDPGGSPTRFPSGWVTDISFASPTLGFAVLDSNANNNADAGILITTNGGTSWVFDDAVGTPDSGRGIYYNTTNNRLYVSSADRGLVVSTDDGGTWSVLDTNKYYTGFAFNGNGYGVVATEGTICNSRTQNLWLYTTDGGVSWQKTRVFTQSWQPLGIPTTETFFAASTNNCSGINNALLRSDDGGYGFGPIAGYTGGGGDTLSEAMAGDGCEQFASSFSSALGMWVSTNDGANWSVMILSPHPAVDTRFYVSPDSVWSFTADSLFSAPRPKTADIHIWPDTVAFKNAACMTTSDTDIHIFGCNCQNTLQLVGDSIHRFNSNDVAPMQTVPTIPPVQSLCANGLGVDASVHIQFQPTASSRDTADFHFLFNDNGTTVDTVVHMTANGIKPSLQIPTGTIDLSGPSCSATVDTFINIFNPSCDTLVLENIILSENPACQCQLQITGACQLNNLTNGITLLPGESWPLEIDYVPGLKIGCCDASFQISYRTLDRSVDTTTGYIVVNGCTTTNLKPTFRGFNINEASCCTVPVDTTIYFVNITCDTILLETPIITGPNSCARNFRIDSTAPLAAHGYPIAIPPTQHVPITIDINCEGTSCEAYVTFRYTISANFASVACSENTSCSAFASDTLVDTISLTTKSVVTPATITSSTNFGDVNCCDTTELRTVTITAGCKPDTLTAVSLTNSGGHFYLNTSNLSFPLIIQAGQKATFLVGYLPLCNGGSGGTSNGEVAAHFGPRDSITSQLGATSTNLATASPSPLSVSFDSVKSCAGDTCGTVTFTNASCGPIKINVNTPPQNACMTISGVTSNTIPVGGTMVVTACLNPSACGVTGNISNIVIFQITDPNGANFTFDTVTLNAFIEPPVVLDTVTALVPATMCDTSTLNETFTVTSQSTCYTYDIIGLSQSSPQVTVTSPTLPVHIGAGQSQVFNVQFQPGLGSGNLTGSMVLTDSAGNTITVPYDITVTSCGASQTGQLVLTLATDSIITPNCTTGVLSFTVGTSGGGTGEVTGVSVSGSTGFTPAAPTSGPNLPFTGSILFDPNQNGTDSALVTISAIINGDDTSLSFEVHGVVVGVKDSVHIGVVALTQGCIFPNDTMLDTFAVVLRDPVPDSLGVTQLSFIIGYDGNLLWNPDTLNLAPGWHVSSITDEVDGVHITLTYTGNPPSGLTPANTTLLEITQLGAISDSVRSTARVTDAHFNDSAFEACVLKALGSPGDSAGICIDTTGCGGRLIHGLFNNTLQPFSGIEVVPNPAHKGGSAATLHFTTNISGNVNADVLDQLGHSVLTLNSGPLETGDHALAIPTDNMPEGNYFTRISVGGFTVIRKFVLVKE